MDASVFNTTTGVSCSVNKKLTNELGFSLSTGRIKIEVLTTFLFL